MKLHTNITQYILLILSLVSIVTMNAAYAVPQCGTFEMVSMPGRLTQLVPFADGTAVGIGNSTNDPRIQVLRYYDGLDWSEQSLPGEFDGFVFGAAGSTPNGEAWFAGTRSVSVYEIDVVFMRVYAGTIDSVDTMRTAIGYGAPVDISATSSSDVWVLSSRGDVFHYNGSSWTVTDVPPVFVDQRLESKGIYAITPDNVWIAGYGSIGKNADHGYVQHWNGNSWQVISTPYQDNLYSSFFRDIDGSGANDIWIVGENSYPQEAILLHWNGSSWTKKPGQSSNVSMSRVMAMEPDNAWAAPITIKGNGMSYWNGSSWNLASELVFPANAIVSVRDVEKADICDAWVVGDYFDGTAYQPWAARLSSGDVPPPPPPAELTDIYVANAQITRIQASRRSYFAQATITVLNESQMPVSGAQVVGDFTGPSNENISVTTGSDGTAVFSSQVVSRPDGSWCFDVNNVTAAGATYNVSMNISASACETGSTNENTDGTKGKRKK